jgi:hypothetical protein
VRCLWIIQRPRGFPPKRRIRLRWNGGARAFPRRSADSQKRAAEAQSARRGAYRAV